MIHNIPSRIEIYNSRIKEGDLITGVKEMKKLLASAEKPENAYKPKRNKVNNKSHKPNK